MCEVIRRTGTGWWMVTCRCQRMQQAAREEEKEEEEEEEAATLT